MAYMKGMIGIAGSCRELSEDDGDGGKGGWEGGLRAKKSWQRLAELRDGDGKPQSATSCQIMACRRGFERAAASCR